MITALLLYLAGLGYFAFVAYLRVTDYRARFIDLPMSGDTLSGGLPGALKTESLL